MNIKTLFTCVLAMASVTIVFSQTELTGTWKSSEIQVESPDTNFVLDFPDGLLLFTDSHYSLMFVRPESERPDISQYRDLEVPQAEASSLYKSFIAQSGGYKVLDSKLLFKPMVAKRPDVMNREYPAEYEINVQKNALWFISKSQDGKSVYKEKWTRVE